MLPIGVAVDHIYRLGRKQNGIAAGGVVVVRCCNHKRPGTERLLDVLLHIGKVSSLQVVIELSLGMKPFGRSLRALSSTLEERDLRSG